MKALLVAAAIGIVGASEATPISVHIPVVKQEIVEIAKEHDSEITKFNWCKKLSLERVRCSVNSTVTFAINSTEVRYEQSFIVDAWPRYLRWNPQRKEQ